MPRADRSRQNAVPPPGDTDALNIDYSAHPELYRVLRGELNVFKTNPYSAEMKELWRFKDEAVALKSAEELYARFQAYR
jgi:hypothetical protein